MGKREKIRARRIKLKVAERRGSSGKFAARPTETSHRPQTTSKQTAAGSRKVFSLKGAGKILVVGDGDFSFSRGLVRHMGSGKDLVLTSYDSAQELLAKYPQAKENVEIVKKGGARVMHGIDATRLQNHFGAERFDRIVFNFPHSGEQRVHLNRALLRDFFASAKTCLTVNGKVNVTLKMRPPYSEWNVEERAAESGMYVVDILPFDQKAFPGYRHQTTKADAKIFVAASEHESRLCKTFVFAPRRPAARPDAPSPDPPPDRPPTPTTGTAKKQPLQNATGPTTDSARKTQKGKEQAEGIDALGESAGKKRTAAGELVRPKAAKSSAEAEVKAAGANKPVKEGAAKAAGGGKPVEQEEGEEWWTKERLAELMGELESVRNTSALEWGAAGVRYAEATEEEIEDLSAIDAHFDPSESAAVSGLPLHAMLGPLGAHAAAAGGASSGNNSAQGGSKRRNLTRDTDLGNGHAGAGGANGRPGGGASAKVADARGSSSAGGVANRDLKSRDKLRARRVAVPTRMWGRAGRRRAALLLRLRQLRCFGG